MAPPEANHKLEAVFVTDANRYAHLLGDEHGPVHDRRSWRLLINGAIVVLLLSCAPANSSLDEERADVASRYSNLGRESYAKGQYQKAIGYYEKALAINREALGEKHPSTAITFSNMGVAWHALGQYQKAIGYFEKALAIYSGILPKGHPNVRATEQNLAEAKNQQTR